MNVLQRMRALQGAPAPARPSVPLSARLGRTDAALPEGVQQLGRAAARSRMGRPEVSWSSDVARVRDLPRRQVDEELQAELARAWTARLRRPVTSCDCAVRFGRCITDLNLIQGWALEEASTTDGLLAPIGVGHGKTGIDILLPMALKDCRRALLLIPGSLREQFARDFEQWSVHFNVPNLGGGRGSFTPGRPVLHVYSYNDLSLPKNTALFTTLSPDAVIADEAQNLKDHKAARTARFLRYLAEHPETRFFPLSGSMTTRSIKDYAHLSEHALKDGSPLPLHWPAVEDWAGAIDPTPPGGFSSPIGALKELCAPGEKARSGFYRRLVDTPGVVATEDSALATPLVITERPAPAIPKAVKDAIDQIRGLEERPDGEQLVDQMQVAACARQAACGFFYRWIWPHGELDEVILEWLAARKDWHKELRERLKRRAEHLDSPHLLEQAAKRHLAGYRGELPTWNSATYGRWLAVRDRAHPETETVWIDRYLAADAAAWARSMVGIVWFEFAAFGRAVAEAGGHPYYGGGSDASRDILNERGDRSIVASIRAHGTGKNLQRFHHNLFANVPSDAGVWEQALGRTHRFGQIADVVEGALYRHTQELCDAFDTALARAKYVEETVGNKQKLCRAAIRLDA